MRDEDVYLDDDIPHIPEETRAEIPPNSHWKRALLLPIPTVTTHLEPVDAAALRHLALEAPCQAKPPRTNNQWKRTAQVRPPAADTLLASTSRSPAKVVPPVASTSERQSETAMLAIPAKREASLHTTSMGSLHVAADVMPSSSGVLRVVSLNEWSATQSPAYRAALQELAASQPPQ
eukprot:TRINITY_DN36270_c0_g1_i1.p1 TRINITY_DN36270_c0_g1~~TRINITY_DN36270_c0_g1_i1.p1  ORF type:complete len:177 (-),score=29.23 TRINITY_DN36270_c0_g1_i1:92-622(-)